MLNELSKPSLPYLLVVCIGPDPTQELDQPILGGS